MTHLQLIKMDRSAGLDPATLLGGPMIAGQNNLGLLMREIVGLDEKHFPDPDHVYDLKMSYNSKGYYYVCILVDFFAGLTTTHERMLGRLQKEGVTGITHANGWGGVNLTGRAGQYEVAYDSATSVYGLEQPTEMSESLVNFFNNNRFTSTARPDRWSFGHS